MARTSIEDAAGLTAGEVLHKRFSALPVTATIGEVRAWFGASPHRRMAFLADGDRYAGKVKQRVRDGHGVYVWASGERHEGEWQKGKRQGHGVSVTPDGTETAGQWKDDRRVPGAG